MGTDWPVKTHKVAVWQGYALFRPASCNSQQRKELT